MLKYNEQIFDPPIDNIVWCYGVEQKEFFEQLREVVPSIKFVEGFPAREVSSGELFPKAGHNMLILDDLMTEVSDSAIFEKIWTKVHTNFVIFFHIVRFLVQSPSRLQRRPYLTKSLSNRIGDENGQQKFDPHVHIQMR